VIRKILQNLQLRHKLIMLNLFITGIVFLLAAIVLFVTEYISLRDSLLNDLTTQARIIAGNSTACLYFNDQKAAGEMLAVLKSSPSVECAAIYAREGKVFATYRRSDGMNIAPPVSPPVDGQSFTAIGLIIVRGIELDRERIGTIYIRSDLKKLHYLMLQHGLITLIILVIVFAVAYELISRWQRVIIDPIMHLYQIMKLVSWQKDYSLRAQVYGEDEIGSLAQGFNAMLEQIRDRDVKLQKEIAVRRGAEEQVRALNEGLEIKVEEKTRELIAIQEDMVRKEKLAILGQLSGCVGHELRNPLGVMNNAVYYLKSVVPEKEETFREYLEIIKQEIDNSQRIITDLLDFSRTKVPQTGVIKVGELIRKSVERCAIPENVTLETMLPETIPAVRVDPLQIGQVLQNLIVNGVQAMPGGGTMRISVRTVRGTRDEGRGTWNEERGDYEKHLESSTSGLEPHASNLEPDGDFIEISIEDTGMGISTENMKKLFQPLFTTKARGIGLGLTVCKNLVEANGGRIGAESEEGKGTRFTILLPMEG